MLDDEFAVALERRNTNATTSDDRSSGRQKKRKGRKTEDGKGLDSLASSQILPTEDFPEEQAMVEDAEAREEVRVPSIADLKLEEDRVRREEEDTLEQRRQAARKLATDRGLAINAEEEQEASEAGVC